MDKKIKLLMLVNYIPHYRIPVINKLGCNFDLTVAHYADRLIEDTDLKFKQILLTPKYFCGFLFYKENIFKLANNFDVVLSLSEIRVIPNMLLGFKKRNFGLVYWGIGVAASYTKEFDSDNFFLKRIRMYLSSRADALIFYSDYPVKKYMNFGVSKERLFVANNTVEVKDRVDTDNEKKHFIFVGTLYKQKRIYELLDAYVLYMASSSIVKPLVLVGDGDEMEPIKSWIINNDLEKHIILKGSVFNQEELKFLYQDAIACISPGQAGLTVLNSMAYGVPFVTSENAITGGEIFNIIHNETGIIYDGAIDSLCQNMKKLSEDSIFLKRLSKNAQDFYFENRTIDIMVKGFLNAVHFASKIPNK